MEHLFAWAASQGVDCGLIAGDASNRTVVAAHDTSPDKAFVTIPPHLLLHAGLCEKDAMFGVSLTKLKKQAGNQIDSRHLLCLLLILERAKGTDSFWYHFIQYLPKSYDDPLWWQDTEVAMLAGTRLELAVKEHRKTIARLTYYRDQMSHLQSSATDTEGFRLLNSSDNGWALSGEAILWAKSTVWSRAFNIAYHGAADRPGLALLPIADLLDHDPRRHVGWHTGPAGSDAFQFITFTPVKKGEVLYSNYGNKSNEELILGYGFALPDNQADFFHVMIGLADSPSDSPESSASAAMPDERVVQRRALLQRLGLSTSHYLKLQQQSKPGLPPTVAVQSLLNTAAICLMPDHLAYHWWQAPAVASKQHALPAGDTPRAHDAQAPAAMSKTRALPAGDDSNNLVAHSPAAVLEEPDRHSSNAESRVPGLVEMCAVPAGVQMQQGNTSSGRKTTPETQSQADAVNIKPQTDTECTPTMQPQADKIKMQSQAEGVSTQDNSISQGDGSPFDCSPVHVQLQVLHTLRHLLTAKLRAIAGGSAEDDMMLTRQRGCSHAAHMALRYRAGQKHIAAAALQALAQKATQTVAAAAAKLPGLRNQSSAVDKWSEAHEAWCDSLGVQCNNLKCITPITAVSKQQAHNGPQSPAPATDPSNQQTHNGSQFSPSATDASNQQAHRNSFQHSGPESDQHQQQAVLARGLLHSCGLATTAAVQPGNVLLTIPPYAVVTVAQPDTIVQLARIAMFHPSDWHSSYQLSPAALLQIAKDGSIVPPDLTDQQHIKDVTVAAEMLHYLAKWWLSSGAVRLTLPARLLLAQLWPDHPVSQQTHKLAASMAGLPVEQELMADVQQLQQQLQVLMPLLHPAQLDESSLIHKAHVSLLWANSCIQQFGRPNVGSQGIVLAPVINSVPQELIGVAADLTWDKASGNLNLVAACHLPANTPLTEAWTAVAADSEHLIMSFGPEALAWTQQTGQKQEQQQQQGHHQQQGQEQGQGQGQEQGQGPSQEGQTTGQGQGHGQGQGSAELPWQTPGAASYQLCIEPPEDDEARELKLSVLTASGLGTLHVLSASSSQERLLASLAVCGSTAAQLASYGAQALLEAFKSSNNAIREQGEGAISSGQQESWDKAEQQLRQLQTAVMTQLIQDATLQQAAVETLLVLLEGEHSQLASEDIAVEQSASSEGAGQIVDEACRDLSLYRHALMQILDVHMASANCHKKHHKRKKTHGSSRHKRKHAHI